MNKFLDILIPRFITEDVALRLNENDEYEVVCSMKDLGEYEQADAVMSMTSFNLFGLALFPKAAGAVRKC